MSPLSSDANPSVDSWTISVKDLVNSPGAMRTLNGTLPAPDSFGVPLLGVPEGDEISLELRLEAVHEGILVSGIASAEAFGECSRCLDPLDETLSVDVQELFLFEPDENAGDDEEERLVVREAVDIEPVVRDAVVTSLPFQPVCRPDCPGLCAQCGIRLEDAPEDHFHEQLDPRWAALAAFASETDTEDTGSGQQNPNNETEER